MWHYPGLCACEPGDLAAAKADRVKLAALQKGKFAKYDAFNVPAAGMIEVALASVDGEIARKSGDLPGAVAAFAKARRLEVALPYTEPAYWHRPVSHLLGAALLEAGKPAEAEAVYRDSLKSYRRDGWALTGLAKAQGKVGDARGSPRLTSGGAPTPGRWAAVSDLLSPTMKWSEGG